MENYTYEEYQDGKIRKLTDPTINLSVSIMAEKNEDKTVYKINWTACGTVDTRIAEKYINLLRTANEIADGYNK